MQNRTKAVLSGILAAVMVLGTVLGVPFGVVFPAFAADNDNSTYTEYSSGAVLITESGNYLIKDGVFSVTVTGATGVNIIFENVNIDHRYASDKAQTVAGLYDVATALGWTSGTGTGTGTTQTAQVCPLLITGNSSVTVAFRRENNLYAGTNGCTVTSGNYYTPKQGGGGFAGVQVDAGSTLTISPSGGVLNAYGAYYVDTDNSNNVPNNTLFNSSTNNDSIGYGDPAGIDHMKTGGGAGIGGGATYSGNANNTSYKAGTPGTIIINGGTINAYGGHQAAGIGGAINSAATASSITIKAGTITAKGGRWAAGIGDGDSIKDAESTCFQDKYDIIIEGGIVNAIGGVACPGIGSTDQMTNVKKESGLKITLNGGQITARSGYPDGFDPSTGNNFKTITNDTAAAAIGAGNGTNMADQSIYIRTGADIIASGFGHYSIKIDGTSKITDEKAPSITIEQSRLYNGRFPDLTSSEDRDFTLYEALRATINVVHRENGVDVPYELHGLVFVSQPTTSDEKERRYFYDTEKMVLIAEEVDGNGDTVHDADGNVKYKILAWGAEEQEKIGTEFNDHHLTLYVDEDHSQEIKSVKALKYFRSIALSLPDPETHGGIYVLRIPTSQVKFDAGVVEPASGHITVTIEANTTTNIWSEVSYPSSYNSKLDAISAAFDKVDLRLDGSTSSTENGLIGEDYHKSIYAYTIYVNPGVTDLWLYAMFYNERGVEYSIKWRHIGTNLPNNVPTTEVELDQHMATAATDKEHGEYYILEKITLGETETQRDIILRKTDTGVSKQAAHSVIYRITIKRKAEYIIKLNPLDKVYDGKPVAPTIDEVVGSINFPVEGVTQEDLDSVEYTFSQGTNQTLASAPKDAGSYSVTAVINAQTYIAKTAEAVEFRITQKPLTVSRIENYLTYVTKAELDAWLKTDKDKHAIAIDQLGMIVLNGVVAGDTVNVSVTNAYYNDLTVGYGAEKITLEGVTLTGAGAANYAIDGTQKVFGQISYRLDGAIFRKNEGGKWDKFYPTDSTTPVNGTSADYHSPANTDTSNGTYTSHLEYIYARTQGKGEQGAVYAMELEFGNMQFTYTEKVWNPDTMEYEEAENGGSFWLGFDGKNNHVTVYNRSNKQVFCTVTAKIDFLHEIHGSGNSGIGVGVYGSNDEMNDTTNISGVAQTVPAATAGNSQAYGTVGTKQFFIRLNGVPALVDGGDFTSVGNLTIKFSTT